MAGDKAEGNFDAVISKAPTLFAGFLRTAFDGANGGDSGAPIRAMTNLGASQGLVNLMDGKNPPTFEA